MKRHSSFNCIYKHKERMLLLGRNMHRQMQCTNALEISTTNRLQYNNFQVCAKLPSQASFLLGMEYIAKSLIFKLHPSCTHTDLHTYPDHRIKSAFPPPSMFFMALTEACTNSQGASHSKFPYFPGFCRFSQQDSCFVWYQGS